MFRGCTPITTCPRHRGIYHSSIVSRPMITSLLGLDLPTRLLFFVIIIPTVLTIIISTRNLRTYLPYLCSPDHDGSKPVLGSFCSLNYPSSPSIVLKVLHHLTEDLIISHHRQASTAYRGSGPKICSGLHRRSSNLYSMPHHGLTLPSITTCDMTDGFPGFLRL